MSSEIYLKAKRKLEHVSLPGKLGVETCARITRESRWNATNAHACWGCWTERRRTSKRRANSWFWELNTAPLKRPLETDVGLELFGYCSVLIFAKYIQCTSSVGPSTSKYTSREFLATLWNAASSWLPTFFFEMCPSPFQSWGIAADSQSLCHPLYGWCHGSLWPSGSLALVLVRLDFKRKISRLIFFHITVLRDSAMISLGEHEGRSATCCGPQSKGSKNH